MSLTFSLFQSANQKQYLTVWEKFSGVEYLETYKERLEDILGSFPNIPGLVESLDSLCKKIGLEGWLQGAKALCFASVIGNQKAGHDTYFYSFMKSEKLRKIRALVGEFQQLRTAEWYVKGWKSLIKALTNANIFVKTEWLNWNNARSKVAEKIKGAIQKIKETLSPLFSEFKKGILGYTSVTEFEKLKPFQVKEAFSKVGYLETFSDVEFAQWLQKTWLSEKPANIEPKLWKVITYTIAGFAGNLFNKVKLNKLGFVVDTEDYWENFNP